MKATHAAMGAMLLAINAGIATAGDPWPGAHNKDSNPYTNQIQQSQSTERTVTRDLVGNPELLREMMKRRETRQQIMQDKEMMKEMMENRTLRKDMAVYPEMRDQIMRDPELRELMNGENRKNNLEKTR